MGAQPVHPTGDDSVLRDLRRQASATPPLKAGEEARLLQQSLGFSGDAVDGCVGPETLAAAAKADARLVIEDLAERQAAYYRGLADFAIFGRGWLARTDARRTAALAMIAPTATREV